MFGKYAEYGNLTKTLKDIEGYKETRVEQNGWEVFCLVLY